MPTKKQRRDGDRYDVTGNVEDEFVDRAKRVLVNKKGITTLRVQQLAEEDGLVSAYGLLVSETRTDTPMTNALLRHIHDRIFGELYDWAGRWRTVRISKPGAAWPPPDFLDQAMDEFEKTVFRAYPASSIQTDEAFCQALGHIQGEFLAIHPFREGNARTIKLLTDLLALQTGRPILRYDMTAKGRREYITAAKAALNKQDYRPMEVIIRQALDAGLKQPS